MSKVGDSASSYLFATYMSPDEIDPFHTFERASKCVDMADLLVGGGNIEIAEREEITARDTVKEKWLGAVAEGSGFVAVPLALLRLQSEYALSATDMLVLINLLAHWWSPESAVYPRNSIIARRMGVDARTIQRSTKKLVDKGLMRRVILPDGKRAFSFEKLAKQVSRDLGRSFEIQRGEVLSR